jgi:hypothetical protein
MTTQAKTEWHITGESVVLCNCAWGCPCQFNAKPTHGRCDALTGFEIREGHLGSTRLDGVKFARLLWFPGLVHEGNGIRQTIFDEKVTAEQREALRELDSGAQGGAFFEVFAAVCPNEVEPLIAPITMQIDRAGRRARLIVAGIAEGRAEPIKNPVTGEEHRAQIVLPDGFEYKVAEMANAVSWRVKSDAPLVFEYEDTYAQLNEFDWGNG